MTRPAFRVFATRHHGGLTSVVLLRRFRPEYVGDNPAGINATVTLTPKGGLKFKIRELS